MKICLLICGIISCVINFSTLYYAIRLYRRESRAKRVLSSIQIYTIGLFFSVVFVFLPIYYMAYSFGDSYAYIRPVLLSVYTSLRIFILDGDFEKVQNALAGQSEWLRVLYSFYCAILYVVAPLMTLMKSDLCIINTKKSMLCLKSIKNQ